jgi:hypothetical protein
VHGDCSARSSPKMSGEANVQRELCEDQIFGRTKALKDHHIVKGAWRVESLFRIEIQLAVT